MSDTDSHVANVAPHSWRARLARLRKPVVVVAGVGTVLGGLAGYVTVYRTVAGPQSPSITAPTPTKTGAQTEAMSILVLPLANQTGEPSRQYIADGFTSIITADLSRIRDAVIVPPLAALAISDKRLSLRQLSEQFKVRFVLDGAVAAVAERLRVTVRLSDAVQGRQIWAHVHEAPLSDLFSLQDELTARVRASVGPQMVLSAAASSSTTGRPQIADLIVQLRAFDMQHQTGERMQRQERMAREVLARQPDEPRAQAALAAALVFQVVNFYSELGLSLKKQSQMLEEASGAVVRAIAAMPEDVSVLHTKALIETARGKGVEAMATLERARTLDARSARTLHLIGLLHLKAGRLDEAESVLRQALKQPRFLPPIGIWHVLGVTLQYQKKTAEALSLFRQAYEASPDNSGTLWGLALALALDGKLEESRSVVSELRRRYPNYIENERSRPLVLNWEGRQADAAYAAQRELEAEVAVGLRASPR